MTDYSHIAKWALKKDIERYGNGMEMSDGRLIDVIKHIEPPLLTKRDLRSVFHELDYTKPRKRGAPIGGIAPRKLIADKIEKLDRSDISRGFLEALAARMRSGKRIFYTSSEAKTHRIRKKSDRDMFVRGVFRDVKLLLNDSPTIHHEILGSIDIKEEYRDMPPATCAMAVTQDILREKLGVGPPSIGRMFNIVSHQK